MYSQAIHYANRMVYLLIPMESSRNQNYNPALDEERASNSITNRYAFIKNSKYIIEILLCFYEKLGLVKDTYILNH